MGSLTHRLVVISDHDRWGGAGGDEPTLPIAHGKNDAEANLFLVVTTVAGDAGGKYRLSLLKVNKVAAVEKNDALFLLFLHAGLRPLDSVDRRWVDAKGLHLFFSGSIFKRRLGILLAMGAFTLPLTTAFADVDAIVGRSGIDDGGIDKERLFGRHI